MAEGPNDTERENLITLAMQVAERRGEEVSIARLANEQGVTRTQVVRHFPDDDALFDAVVERWYAPEIVIMEEVLASDLPIQRKFYEFFARRFVRERERYRKDPQIFALYCELGTARFEQVRGYIDLADHYLSELIAHAQAEGHFAGLSINRALTLINQMVLCYTSPQVMLMLEERLAEDKLAAIIDTMFAGLKAGDSEAAGVTGLRLA
ncbi:TetR/AcrR family transcriptional regulator [Altererythrobacter sp. ZODW24]|uniref:TetR/AcrR family transcriptional regulator n=1 Tax=Altererythrobacter sp. ZODW24 TaxID=2185142 RepID=UPI0013B39425|nr:TetR/AcrR family transcriptional regulator [Altererythrobacter sp. ZODW24]